MNKTNYNFLFSTFPLCVSTNPKTTINIPTTFIAERCSFKRKKEKIAVKIGTRLEKTVQRATPIFRTLIE